MDAIRADLDTIFVHETESLTGRQVTARVLRGWVLASDRPLPSRRDDPRPADLRSMLHYVGRLEAE